MAASCCTPTCPSDPVAVDARYRRALWIALVLNAAMFAVELGGSWLAGSVSLLADSIDFAGVAGITPSAWRCSA